MTTLQLVLLALTVLALLASAVLLGRTRGARPSDRGGINGPLLVASVVTLALAITMVVSVFTG